MNGNNTIGTRLRSGLQGCVRLHSQKCGCDSPKHHLAFGLDRPIHHSVFGRSAHAGSVLALEVLALEDELLSREVRWATGYPF